MESAINEEVRFSEVNVIAATFVDELEAKQIEHKSWYQPLENQQEEAFGNAMREALTMGRSIATMEKRRMDDAVLFHTTLTTASVLGANLIQLYKSLDKNEDAFIARQFLAILQATQDKMRNWIENDKPIGETSETSGNTNPAGKTFPRSDGTLSGQIKQSNTGPEAAQRGKNEPDIKSRLISDTFTAGETDVLQYDVIAQNLFAIMTDKGTNPPLNIGVFAPWGRGKTSLMKRLQSKFDEERKKIIGPEDPGFQKLKGWRQMLRWLRNDESKPDAPKLPYATVWFNPWNYQSSDMIWAGMADAVIEQVVGQIPSRARKETFWMQLRLSRLAKERIRKDIQTRLLFYFLQLSAWGGLILLAFVFFFLNKAIPWALIGVGGIGSIIASVASKINPLSKSISEEFDKYSEAPKYQEKTGTFHEVQADLNKVLDLCIDDTKPLVIFVDDLDRCSPSKVVEVVEAINVFINGRFNTKCYFILGMDGELVAGALDVSYEKMKGKLGSREMDQGSIGWYFLDKFIQLPYFIPVMSESKKKEYLSNLLSETQIPGTTGRPGSVAKDPSAPADMAKVGEVAKTVLSTSDNQESSQVIKDAGLSSAEQKELDKLILQNQVESEKQNEMIRKQVSAYAPFISSDPRSLKRFANLLRFYSAYQFLRMKKGQPYVEAPILAKWLAIMLKFPQLVRWIQWDSENKSGIHTAAEEKVKLLDDLLEGFLKNKGDLEFTGWLKYEVPASLSNNGEVFLITKFDDVPWLRSRKLFDILMNEQAALSSFKNALECNVW